MKHVKDFFSRGLIFGGLGPVIYGIICMCISFKQTVPFNGIQIFAAVLSTYLLAFINAGTSVFKEVENWSHLKAAGLQLLVLYVIYTICYLINSWIPFNWVVLAIYTGIFILTYVVIWFIIYLIVRKTTKDMNVKINN